MNIRIVRVLIASLAISTTGSAAITLYKSQPKISCIDDLSELNEIAAAETKRPGQVAVNFEQVYFDKHKQQWCYRSEMD
jgi:hypothetical protein